MTESDKGFVGSIPEINDTYLVPLIFETYARDLAKRVAVLDAASISETAAGSGVVVRLALSYEPLVSPTERRRPIERRRDSNAAKPSSNTKVRLMAPPPDLRFTTGRS